VARPRLRACARVRGTATRGGADRRPLRGPTARTRPRPPSGARGDRAGRRVRPGSGGPGVPVRARRADLPADRRRDPGQPAGAAGAAAGVDRRTPRERPRPAAERAHVRPDRGQLRRPDRRPAAGLADASPAGVRGADGRLRPAVAGRRAARPGPHRRDRGRLRVTADHQSPGELPASARAVRRLPCGVRAGPARGAPGPCGGHGPGRRPRPARLAPGLRGLRTRRGGRRRAGTSGRQGPVPRWHGRGGRTAPAGGAPDRGRRARRRAGLHRRAGKPAGGRVRHRAADGRPGPVGVPGPCGPGA
jgi:hypothetical protein